MERMKRWWKITYLVVIKTSGHFFVDSDHPSLDKALNRARSLIRSIKIESGEPHIEVIVFEEKKRYRKRVVKRSIASTDVVVDHRECEHGMPSFLYLYFLV